MTGKNSIIEKLIEHENRIGDLYEIYSRKLIDLGDFWSQLACEERCHAKWIKTLYKKHGHDFFNSYDLTCFFDTLEISLAFIREKINEVNMNDKFNVERAMEAAIHIENTILEQKFFEQYARDNIEQEITFQALRLSTKDHFSRIGDMWLEESQRTNEEMKTKEEFHSNINLYPFG